MPQLKGWVQQLLVALIPQLIVFALGRICPAPPQVIVVPGHSHALSQHQHHKGAPTRHHR